jgi:hypothetical protein
MWGRGAGQYPVSQRTKTRREKIGFTNKLRKVKVQITDRFPPADMEHCRLEEQFYREAFFIYSEVAYIEEDANERLRALAGPDGHHLPPIEGNRDKAYDCSERFIGTVCGYFREKYAVIINNPEWKDYDGENGHRYGIKRYDVVPLQYILDSIYGQMGGMSFEEKAFHELKEDARGAVLSYSGESRYALNGAKLVIDNFYYSCKDRIWGRYKAKVEDRHRAFFQSLSHYEYGAYGIAQKYQFLCGRWEIDEDESVYDRHPISSAVIEYVRVFKNGKIEVAFRGYQKAVKFMETYFPGIPQKATEQKATKQKDAVQKAAVQKAVEQETGTPEVAAAGNREDMT